MQVVIFRLNDEQFAVETAKVESIEDMMEITRIPKAPSHIKGLINRRGNVISLLDLNLLIGVNKTQDSEQKNIIILEMEDELVGTTVDQVDEVLDVDESLIEKLDDRKKSYIKGIVNFEDRIVTLIDIDKLLSN